MSDKEKVIIDSTEMDIAEQEAQKAQGEFKLVFKKPKLFEYDGKKYEELSFDFEKLTGRDSLDIESELQRLGRALVVPAFSGEYLIRMASKACEQPIGSDGFEQMALSDFNKIRGAARSFLLKSES